MCERRTGNPSPLRAFFVVLSLNAGGAEHIVMTILKKLSPSDIHVDLIALDGRGTLVSHVPSAVTLHDLGKRSRFELPRAVTRLRRLVRSHRPDVVVSFLPLTNVVTALSLWGEPVPLVANECTHTGAYLSSEPLGRILRIGLRLAYRRASLVVTNCEASGNFLVRRLKLQEGNLRIIPISVDSAKVLRLASEPAGHPWFTPGQPPVVVAIGRLALEKGFLRLLEAFELLLRRVSAHLVVIGDGPERAELEARASSLGIADRVVFLGYVENPYPFLQRAAALAISSYFEGGPIVALEAMVCGVPIVGFQGIGGLDDLSDHGRAALLVEGPEASAFAAGMYRALTDLPLRASLIEAGRLRVRGYEVDMMVKTFAGLLWGVSASRGAHRT